MTEEQRVKLESLIADFEVTVVTANADWGTAEFRKWARKQKQEAHDRITDFLTEIQKSREVRFKRCPACGWLGGRYEEWGGELFPIPDYE